MGTTSSWRTIVEVVFDKNDTPCPQRRPYGHVNSNGGTKAGNKKRGIRRKTVSLLEDEGEDEDDEDDGYEQTAVDLLSYSMLYYF